MRRAQTLQFKHAFKWDKEGQLTDHYDVDRTMLGEGSYGQVSKGRCKATGNMRAIKSIDTSKLADTSRFEEEVAIQAELDHPNIVKLYETFKDAKRVYLVMELCTGGELFDRIVDEAAKHEDEGHEGQAFNEEGAATYMTQILGAMNYLHDHHFVHRDIKPENFLLTNPERDAQIKVIDFGLAKKYEPGVNELMKTKAGTPYYVAPQVLQGKYDEKCDVWSCGVITYILLCGYPPFYGERDEDILRRVKRGQFDFPSPDWDEISRDGKEIIKKMLTLDASKRPSCRELLEHPWLRDHSEKATGTVHKNIVGKLRTFTGSSRLKKVALTLIAQQLDESAIEEMKQTFKALDVNNDGTLTPQEVRDGMNRAGVVMPADLDATIRSLDTDGSGSIDYTEFIAATMTTKQYLKKEVVWSAFRVFDKDNDGKISKEELAQILKDDNLTREQMSVKLDEIIEEADTDKDGEISFAEFMAMMEKPSQSVAL